MHDDLARSIRELQSRLLKGAEEYGDQSFNRPLPATARELLEEILDIAGWALVMHVQLSHRLKAMEQLGDLGPPE